MALTAATIALVPEQAETFVSRFAAEPRLAPIDEVANTARSAIATELADAVELFWKTNNPIRSSPEATVPVAQALLLTPLIPRSPLAKGASAREDPVTHLIPGQNLAIRTKLDSDLQDLLHYSRSGLDLRLTSMAPPYTASGPGQFEIRLAYVAGTIERSLFEAGQEAGLSDPLIFKLAEIFGWDIDFALDVQPGDNFGVAYEQKFWLGRKIGDGPILAAEFSNQGTVYRAIGFRGPSGSIGYYTPEGQNLKRTFLRTPVKFSRVSSRFTKSRYHPILKLWRAHNGVDYAAPAGTPVRATASGRIISLGWNGGYGNTVVISHGGAFSTLYAHLSGHRANLKTGQRVEQGEVIGYVGKSGLATGAHLHYEFLVNGKHQNPLTFNFPGGDPIAPEVRDGFLQIANEWVSRLQLISSRHLATAATQ